MCIWIEKQLVAVKAHFPHLIHSVTSNQASQGARELAESNQALITVLESIDADVYVSDFETNEILFANKHIRDSFNDDLVGQKCFQVFRNEISICSHCKNNKLLDAGGQPTGNFIWECQNPITGWWYRNSDRAIRWGDGRYVHLQIATDITENKQAQDEIQKQMQVQVALRKAGSAISSSLNIGTVLTRIAEEMGRAIDVTSAYINSYEPKTEMSSVLAEYFSPDANMEERVSDLHVSYPEDGNNDFFELMHSGQHDTTHAGDAGLSEYERAEIQKCGIQSILYIPLRIREQLIGYAELWETRRHRVFSSEEITLCRDLAQQAAIALENAHSYELAQQEIAERKQVEIELQNANEQLKTQLAEIKSLETALREQAIRDPLTGLYNRRYMKEVLKQEISRATRKKESLSIVILDLDHLKTINDTYGHMTGGDKALQTLADTLKQMCREEDTLCRYAGDEFLVILHDTPAQVAYKRALQWKEVVSKTDIASNGKKFRLSFSAGVASFPIHGSTSRDILIGADNALYRAKEFGRDQIVIYQKQISI